MLYICFGSNRKNRGNISQLEKSLSTRYKSSGKWKFTTYGMLLEEILLQFFISSKIMNGCKHIFLKKGLRIVYKK